MRWGGARKPTGFVISKGMKDGSQLVGTLTVLFNAWLLSVPCWNFLGSHWPPKALSQRATAGGTHPPKLLVLITQKDSSPDSSGMRSPLGSPQAGARIKARLSAPELKALCTRQPRSRGAHFCSAPDHTRDHKHCKPHMRLNTLPRTRRQTQRATVTQTWGPWCAVKSFPNTRSSAAEMTAGTSEELYHGDLTSALEAT